MDDLPAWVLSTIDRKVERVYSDVYLGDDRMLQQVDTLRHYSFSAASRR